MTQSYGVSELATPLSVFADQIDSSRAAVYDGLKTLPLDFQSAIRESYEDRIDRGNGKPLLGEYAPMLLADLLPLQDRAFAISCVSVPWMYIYASVLLLDDAMDRSGSNTSQLLIGGTLLMQKGITALMTVLKANEATRTMIDGFCQEAATAAMQEISMHRGRWNNYSVDDISNLGRKIALLKLCAASLLHVDGQSVSPEDLLYIEELATGMQLLDDATDWWEDWQVGNYTLVLTKTHDYLVADHCERFVQTDQIAPSLLLLCIAESGSLSFCVEEGVRRLRIFLGCHSAMTDSVGWNILNGIANEHMQTLADLDAMLTKPCSEFRGTHPTGDWLNAAVLDCTINKGILWLEERLRITAQNT